VETLVVADGSSPIATKSFFILSGVLATLNLVPQIVDVSHGQVETAEAAVKAAAAAAAKLYTNRLLLGPIDMT
jgi:hypothetical protein